jgi:TolB protein
MRGRILGLTAALAVLAGCTGGVKAVTSQPGRSIVFTTDRTGAWQLHRMDLDGTHVSNLSQRDGVTDGAPACSPDGSTIAFFRGVGDSPIIQVWTMKSDGSGQDHIGGLEVGGLNPRGFDPPGRDAQKIDWSPDGNRLLVSGTGEVDVYDLRAPAGDDNPRLAAIGVASWSPDGSRLVYAADDLVTLVVDEDPPSPVRLTEDSFRDSMPDWSPAGSTIAFESAGRDGKFDSDIFVIQDDGSGLTRLTSDPGQDTDPVWSPDGKQIAFVSDRGGDREIFVMNGDGSDQHALTINTDQDSRLCWLP